MSAVSWLSFMRADLWRCGSRNRKTDRRFFPRLFLGGEDEKSSWNLLSFPKLLELLLLVSRGIRTRRCLADAELFDELDEKRRDGHCCCRASGFEDLDKFVPFGTAERKDELSSEALFGSP